MGTRLDERPDTEEASNPIQDRYDDTFNALTSPDHYSKDAEEPTTRLSGEGDNGASGSSKPQSNQDSDDTDPNQNTDAVSNLEKSGGSTDTQATDGHTVNGRPEYQKDASTQKGDWRGRAGNMLKKKGAAISLVAILVGGGGTFSVIFGGPAMLLVTIKNAVTNERDDSSPWMRKRGHKTVAKKMDGQKNMADTEKACEKPKSRKCRANTFSDKEVKKMQRNGSVKIETGKKVGNRHIVKSMTITDSGGKKHTVTSGDGFSKLGPGARTAFSRGFNPVTSKFNNSKFGKLLAKAFKTGKGKDKTLEGDSDEELRKSQRKAQGLEESNNKHKPGTKEHKEERDKENNKIVEKLKELLSSKATKAASKIKNPSAFLCGAYDAARLTVGLAVAWQITQYVNFALVFLREADKAQSGEATEAVMAYLGAKLMYSEANKMSGGKPNRFYKTTAMDSGGMKALVTNDGAELSQFANSRTVGGGLILGIKGAISTIQGWMPGGKQGIRSVCKKASSLAGCALSPPWGISTFICAAMVGCSLAEVCNQILSWAAEKTLGWLVDLVLSPLFKYLGSFILENLVDDDTKGIDAGDAIALGAALMLGAGSANNGMLPASKKGVKKYTLNTMQERADMIADARYEAKDTPFDIYNQYSFLGSIGKSLYDGGIFGAGKNFSVFNPSSLMSLMGLIPMATSSLAMATAGAATTKEGFTGPRYERSDGGTMRSDCALIGDDDGEGPGIAGDKMCAPYYGVSSTALNADPEEVRQWMEDAGHADEEGKPESDEYKKYIKYCAERESPTGVAQEPTTDASWFGGSFTGDDTEAWESSEKCMYTGDENSDDSKMLAMFSAYYADGATLDTMEDDYDPTDPNTGEQAVTEDSDNDDTAGPIDSDAKKAAQALLDSPNVKFQLDEQRGYMEQVAKTGQQQKDCGEGPVAMDGKLLGILVEASKKWKITIGAQAAGHGCDDGANHPKGKAVDLNGAVPADQPQQMRIDWTDADKPRVKEFYEYLDKLAGSAGTKMGLGQQQCFGGAPLPKLSNSTMFNDSCNHMHIDVR